MHEISDKTRGNGLVNVKSRPLSSGFLSVWSSVAWAIVIGLGYTASGCGAGKRFCPQAERRDPLECRRRTRMGKRRL